MAKGTLSIHSENILPIIKKWLYSDKEIFVRELVSNACDAISKWKILSEKESLGSTDSFRIDIAIDKEKKTLTFSDNGIGMSAVEVEKYIAQIAFSGAEEFLQKYQGKEEKEQIIGHFGLGFYSSYMASEKVEIETQSYQTSEKPVFWSCDGSATYSLEEGNRTSRGTDITLFIDKDSHEYLEESKIREILLRYCAYLPYPIHLNGAHINNKEPLWIKSPNDVSDKEYIDFYRQLYPSDLDPIFWIHLNVDYPFHLKGILYFPKIHKRFDYSQNPIKLFCSRVFVSDNCKDLLPDYLGILKGAIDSPDIPLNVSRSYLQMDKTVRQLGAHISKKICDKLSSLFKTDREKFLGHWPDIEMIVKLGLLQDEKFYEKCKEFLVWKTTEGNWTTIEEYLEKHREKTSGKVFYTTDEKAEGHFLSLYHDKKIEVLVTNNFVDSPVQSYLESKLDDVNFQRIDSDLEGLVDASREKNVLDAEGKTESSRIADFIRASLNNKDLEVEAKSLASEELPALFQIDEHTRRMRDYMAMTQGKGSVFPQKKTFVVNTNSKLIQKAFKIQTKHPDLAKDLIKQVHDLTLLSQKELDPSEMSQVLSKSTQILERLTALVP
jgi:molecular chaperone HtpG